MKRQCARCGIEGTDDTLTVSGVCALPQERMDACRDRELANLRALLRSVTRQLEKTAELLHHGNASDMNAAEAEIDAVLEALS